MKGLPISCGENRFCLSSLFGALFLLLGASQYARLCYILVPTTIPIVWVSWVSWVSFNQTPKQETPTPKTPQPREKKSLRSNFSGEGEQSYGDYIRKCRKWMA